MANPLDFYDLKARQMFTSSNYDLTVNSKGMLIAKTTAPSGGFSVRVIKKQ